MIDSGNFKLSFSKDSYLDSDKKLKKNVIFIKNEVKNRINIKNILKDSITSNNNNNNKISSLSKQTKNLPNALSETSESTKIQKNSDKNSLVTDLTNKTNPETSQTHNPGFKFSSSNSIICNNINNFININNTNKTITKTNQTKTITNNLNNHCFSNPTLINGNIKNAFSLEKKNTNSYQKINPPVNKLNNIKNSIGNQTRVKNHEISNDEKSEIIKDRSNVLSDQIKKINSKIQYENFNNYSSLHKNNYKESKIVNDINKAKNNLLEYNYKPFETEVKNKSNILNTNFKANKFAIPTNQAGMKNNNIVKNYRELDELNKKAQEEKLRYELLAQTNNVNKYKNKSQIIDSFPGATDKINHKENDKCPNIINDLDAYPSVENSILNKITNFEDASFLKRNEFHTNENHIGKLGLKKINSVIKNTKKSNVSYENNKEKILTDFHHNYSYFITNDPSNGKKTKFIDEIFTNLNYNNTENNINEIENSKLKTLSMNKKLNTSIKSLTNDSINSKNNLNDDLNPNKQDSPNCNLNDISNNNDLFPLVQAPNPNSSQIKTVSKKSDSRSKNYNKGEKFSDTCLNSDLNSYKININQNNIPDSSFSSNNKNISNNKLLQLSFNTQVNPLDTDINIIENNRDKDREKDKLIINEMFNEETEINVKPSNAFSADNYFNKLSDRTHDKNFNKRTYLEKIALKNVGYKNLLNNSKKAKDNPKELQYANGILNSVNNSKNKIPLATQNVKFNLDKSAGGKNNNPSSLLNKKIPYIQVKKYINKYLNEKSANKQNISIIKDSNSIMNYELQSAKILNTDPNENTEKTKIKLMKNLNIDVDLNNKTDANITAKKNSLNQINYLNTAEPNPLADQTQFTDSNAKKTIFSDNQLYEFDENYDLNNLSSERIPYSKNSLRNNYHIDGSEANYSNHLDRGVFIKENKKPDNSVKDIQAKERPKNTFSPKQHPKNICENSNENNNNTILYLSVIEFINRNFKPFEILEIIEKIRSDSIFYLGEMNAKFQIFYSQIDLIKNFIEIALQRKELNVSSKINKDQIHKETQNSESYRSYNTGSSDTRSSGNTKNYNYNIEKIIDDENGNYIVKIGDHIDYRYEIISELGQGSFGQAVKCYDHKNREFVCVKIIKNNKKFIKQSKIEIGLLEFIQENDPEDEKNIVRILNNFPFRNHNVNFNYFFGFIHNKLIDLFKI